MKAYYYLLLILLISACSNGESTFDSISAQTPIESIKQIDSVLNTLTKISISEIDETYFEETETKGRFKRMIKSGDLFKINKNDPFKYIVGTVRIKNFLVHDDYYAKNIGSAGKSYEQIWLIDRKLLYKVLELKQELKKLGNNADGFFVKCGHRHPKHNKAIGGASCSQHIAGKATDIEIQDINNDGEKDQKDKQIVLDLLNKKVIKNAGGIGRYPGTMAVHFDVRGKRARWDSY